MSPSTRIYVFGDQTFDIRELLSKLAHTHDNPLLTHFFEQCTHALKQEVSRLSRDQRQGCPSFATIENLLALWKLESLNPAFCQALTSICHIAILLNEHGFGGPAYPRTKDACMAGLCTGSLAAVTASCASSSSELLSVGVYTARIAFRVGACAWDWSRRLMNSRDGATQYRSWAAVVSTVDPEHVERLLVEFAAEKCLAKTATPYISAHIAPSKVSVSGPPDILDAFFDQAQSLSKAIIVRLPIAAPYHAAHLYTEDDVSAVLADFAEASQQWPVNHIPVISSSAGHTQSGFGLIDGLRRAIRETLTTTLDVKSLSGALAGHIRNVGAAEAYTVVPVATNVETLRPAIHKALGLGVPPNRLAREGSICNAHLDPRHQPMANAKLAIVGMSGRFPRARSMEAFWKILVDGVDCHEKVPASRWPVDTHFSDARNPGKNVSNTGFGCWLHDAADFDARYFNMSPREAPQVDPAQRMALLTATEALEEAGIVPNRTPSTHKTRVGVYFGSTSNDWMETNSAQDIDTYFIPGGNRAFIPGRINYHFKFSGPSYTIDTACSSSLAALHLACNALWKGEIDTAIVGGTNVLTNPDMTTGLDRGHFLSRTGNCKTFDEDADGYCRGEAVATLILKRLDDALADRDPVKACIVSIATNHNADAESITRPHVGTQKELFESVLANANVNVTDISYCELHGTGTQAGDAGETASVINTLAPAQRGRQRTSQQPLFIGAAKANIGHGEAAAGVTSLAKVLLMMKHSIIPPHCGIKTKINHKIPDLATRNTFIADRPIPWARPVGGKRQVMLNNFSAAGGNTAMILEDPPEMHLAHSDDPRPEHLVVLSAKTATSLQANIKSLMRWIEFQTADPLLLARLSYTTTARRIHHQHRVSAVGAELGQVRDHLLRLLENEAGKTRTKTGPKIVFAFTGQGAHFTGMGSVHYARNSAFRSDINRYDQICQQLELPSIRGLFENPSTSWDAVGPVCLQLATLCLEMALFRFWINMGITPAAVVGHSLGEYAALYAAGVLSQTDVISLVGRRALLLETHCQKGSHSMLAVRSDAAGLASVLGQPGKDYELACVNGRCNIVLGGTVEQMASLRPTLTEHHLRSTVLEIPYAYHTSQVEPILESLGNIARGVMFKDPTVPIISPAVGKVFHSAADIPDNFASLHCRGTVNMFEALNVAKNDGLLTENMLGLEVGPAPTVVKMVKEVAGNGFQTLASLRQGEDAWLCLVQALQQCYTAGADIDWMFYHEDFESAQQCLELPSYSWDYKEYWLQYVNDWSLRKGDPPICITTSAIESSSIQKIIKDSLHEDGGELIVESDLTRPDLNPMVKGHKVYGVPLCTPSVYADISLTIGERLKAMLDPRAGVEVAEMTIQSALVANEIGLPQYLRAHATVNHKQQTALVKFLSVDQNGKVREQHAHATIRLVDAEKARAAAQATASTALSRTAKLLSQLGSTGNTFRYSKSMIYKMIGQLADFDPNYRGLVEITLDSDQMEAAGKISFRDVLNDGKFHTNPAFIDALSQLGGFVMNANEGVDLDKELFVNHGWEGMQLFEAISPEKTYRSHVIMTEGKEKLWTGTVTILDGDNVVALFRNVALQGVPKRLMQYIVNAASKHTNASHTTPTTKSTGSAPTTGPPPDQRSAQAPISRKTTRKTTHAGLAAPKMPPAVSTAMNIICEESGIAMSDLTDECRFDDIGVDSLLSLMISSRVRDEMGVDLDPAVMLEYNTVGKFKTHIGFLAGDLALEMPEPLIADGIVTTPAISDDIPKSSAPSLVGDVDVDIDGTWSAVIDVIAQETGIAMSDLTGDTCFNDIGVDSLLSLVICSRLRDEVDVDLPDRALFMDFTTIDALRAHIVNYPATSESGESESDDDGGYPISVVSSATNMTTHAFTTSTEDKFDDDVYVEPLRKKSVTFDAGISLDAPVKPAWSIVLQGSPKRASKILFLFPDGCGAATSYVGIPKLSGSTSVVGFNSPFMKNPSDMRAESLETIVMAYVAGVRKHQAQGPYHLGGWSAGGILAYAVAQELMRRGEEVATMTLLDSPAPTRGLDRLPQRFFDHCHNVGIFGSEMGGGGKQSSTKVPDWLMGHFKATIELLHGYKAPPMSTLPGPRPKVSIMWAGECAFDGDQYGRLPAGSEGDEDTEGMKFLTERRTDPGPGDWALLFPGQDIECATLPHEHHFSMMRDKGAEEVAAFIRKSCNVE